MTKVVAFDPGGTTGYMLWDAMKPDTYTRVGQIATPDHHKILYNLLDNYLPDVIVCENFDYRTGQPSAELISREYIGVIKLHCQESNGLTRLYMQKPSQAIGKGAFWSDEKLAHVGMLITPKHPNRHVNDAIRHFMYWYTFTENNKSFLEKLK